MRIAFAGTPEFARVALSALLAAGHDIPLVLTQPDRPAGRGLKLTPSPVKQAALDAGITVLQPRSLRLDGKYPDEAAAAQDALRAAGIELMVVAAYGLILPLSALTLPPRGCLNIHASLLPRWRGAAPIQRAIEAGDAETGITIMQMDEGLDTGAMLSKVVVPIGPAQTAGELHDVLAQAGGELIVQTLAQAEAGALTATAQPEAGVTYAAKLDKAEALLDWQAPADLLARRVRAFDPVPGASLRLAGLDDPVKVWRASALPATAASVAATPGAILRADAEGIDVATSDGVLRLLALQKAGGKRQPVDVFVRGWTPPAAC
jgi:methionyl-tRNA formyltransferase